MSEEDKTDVITISRDESELKDVSNEKVRSIILDYFEKKDEAFPSDIAMDNDLPVAQVLNVICELKEEGIVEEVETNSEEDENSEKGEFDVDNWHQERTERVGEYLAEALRISFQSCDSYRIEEDIEKALNKLNLPKKECNKCGKEMKFKDYYVKQGYCDNCHEEMKQEMKENK